MGRSQEWPIGFSVLFGLFDAASGWFAPALALSRQ
jgi:hypothetical protein